MQRRRFLAATAASLTVPAVARSFEIDPVFLPQEVQIKNGVPAGQILVMPKAHFLYFVTGPNTALRYGVGVGKAGLEFQGDAIIQAKKEWPTWRPTNEMIEREPRTYARFIGNTSAQPGGRDNPLGARALYLFKDGRDTYFRIHGTTQPNTIGRSVSNGCIRMVNEHVKDLYERVPLGTRVTVI